jgi:hypothetical protein
MHHYLYLGTHETSWLSKAGVPLFISHRRLERLRTSLPVAAAPWALDSGGFSEISLYGGWRTTPAAYVDAVVRYDTEIGKLEWAAIQDWMCEPDMVARTGLSVLEHQKRTVDSYLELAALWAQASDTELVYMPVLQGYRVEEYLQCMDMYADAGVDLGAAPLVGVGSVCRRQHTEEIRAVFEAILERDPGLPVHGFGVKLQGLREYGNLLATADSMAWSFNARKNPPLPGCSHRSCSNCIKWALQWRRKIATCDRFSAYWGRRCDCSRCIPEPFAPVAA